MALTKVHIVMIQLELLYWIDRDCQRSIFFLRFSRHTIVIFIFFAFERNLRLDIRNKESHSFLAQRGFLVKEQVALCVIALCESYFSNKVQTWGKIFFKVFSNLYRGGSRAFRGRVPSSKKSHGSALFSKKESWVADTMSKN